jgi:hypothetical protein
MGVFLARRMMKSHGDESSTRRCSTGSCSSWPSCSSSCCNFVKQKKVNMWTLVADLSHVIPSFICNNSNQMRATRTVWYIWCPHKAVSLPWLLGAELNCMHSLLSFSCLCYIFTMTICFSLLCSPHPTLLWRHDPPWPRWSTRLSLNWPSSLVHGSIHTIGQAPHSSYDFLKFIKWPTNHGASVKQISYTTHDWPLQIYLLPLILSIPSDPSCAIGAFLI